MPKFDTVILPLLATALVFALVELGLAAWAVATWTDTVAILTYDPVYGYDEFAESERASPPGILSFLLFTSIWTVLVVPALIALPMLPTRKDRFWVDSFGKPVGWVAPATLAINAVTMIFWLSGFAAFTQLLGGFAPLGAAGAFLAFAIMLWLIFLGLLIFNLLIAFDAMKSNRMGYHTALFKKQVPEERFDAPWSNQEQDVEKETVRGGRAKGPQQRTHETEIREVDSNENVGNQAE